MALIILLHCCQVELALPAALNHHVYHLQYQKYSPLSRHHQPTAILRQLLMEEPWMYPWRTTSWASLFSLQPPLSLPPPSQAVNDSDKYSSEGRSARVAGACSPSTKSPLANGVHPWHPPWRVLLKGTRSLKQATSLGPDLSCYISIMAPVQFIYVLFFLSINLMLLLYIFINKDHF